MEFSNSVNFLLLQILPGIYMNIQEDFNKFIKDSKRVLKVSRKPDGPEYLDLAKVSSIGVVIIGVIGFIIIILGSFIGL